VTKSDAIRLINLKLGSARLGSARLGSARLGSARLNHGNTHWANVISYGTNEGWWLNIPFHKFAQELHIILNSEKHHQFLHIIVPPGTIGSPRTKFRNKDDTADMFMPCAGRDWLIDVQSGSTRHDFSIYRRVEHRYT
jgi:hypothetical protein